MIHPTAIIADDAVIADDVLVGAYSIIGSQVSIEAGTHIASHVIINGPTHIGCANRIFQFCSIGELPQDKQCRNPTADNCSGRLLIGDNNTIREYCTINRGTVAGGGQTTIGNDNFFMAYVHIAHDCIIANHTIFANAASLAGHVEVGDYAILSGFVMVHQFCRIGQHSYSGMGSGLAKDLPPYVLAAGLPAHTRGLNKIGLRRAGFDEAVIQKLHRAYIDLLHPLSGYKAHIIAHRNIAKQCPEVAHLIEFIELSLSDGRRGLLPSIKG
ncbi:MAG: acyl-ACP--UDP-N-acetylglucosamine O-acyltransferase [Chromatiales bacterium]|nr:acyl-ACP--UDP-N-acetylglucosamine O-acyltransferase [Chromatiales bacterium]